MSRADPGSFRDPASRVFIDEERVLRILDDRGLEGWRHLSKTKFFADAVEAGQLVPTVETEMAQTSAVAALEHPVLPLISYPYEWTFSMLKDAALLHLDLQAGALEAGLIIKDATPFNIQFVRGRPVFIDVGSFETYQPGEPWLGYQQFTRQFLFPLVLRAWVGVPFQPWLRGDMDGPTAAEIQRLLPWWRKLQPSVLIDVVMQARLERRWSGEAVRRELKEAGLQSEMILTNVRRLRRLVESLEWSPTDQGWASYGRYQHVGRDRDDKAAFLVAALQRVAAERVLDLGANDGYFSLLAESLGAHAVAVDGDEAVLEKLYEKISGRNVSVVVSDLTDPSPSRGWAGVERPGLMQRARPEMVVCYGILHHLVYTSSIPPESVVTWLRDFECPVVMEYVAPGDEMVKKLIGNKLVRELHPQRDEDSFRHMTAQRFEIVSEQRLGSGSRILFEAHPR